jgi:predicted RNase H-like HicB family nuclease
MNEYTAIVKRDGDWWIGWIEEVPGANCQEPSRDALLETLRITPEEALEANRSDAAPQPRKNSREVRIAV